MLFWAHFSLSPFIGLSSYFMSDFTFSHIPPGKFDTKFLLFILKWLPKTWLQVVFHFKPLLCNTNQEVKQLCLIYPRESQAVLRHPFLMQSKVKVLSFFFFLIYLSGCIVGGFAYLLLKIPYTDCKTFSKQCQALDVSDFKEKYFWFFEKLNE